MKKLIMALTAVLIPLACGRRNFMIIVAEGIALLIFWMLGWLKDDSEPEPFGINILSQMAPITYSLVEDKSELHDILKVDDKVYYVELDGVHGYFVEAKNNPFYVTFEDNFEAILPYFFNDDEIMKIKEDYQKWLYRYLDDVSVFNYNAFDLTFNYHQEHSYFTITPSQIS